MNTSDTTGAAEKRALLKKRLAAKKKAPPETPLLGKAQLKPGEHYLLSFSQQRLWLLDKIDGPGNHFNMPNALKLAGFLDIAALNKAFRCIVERHESLRICIVDGEDEQPLPVLQEADGFALSFVDLGHLSGDQQHQAVVTRVDDVLGYVFDLEKDFMLRAEVLKLSENVHVLAVVMHHIASDGWSMGILINELCTLYSAFSQGLDNPLQPLALQYTDYAYWQRNWLQGEVLEQQLGYWSKQLAQLPVVHSLPLDFTRPAIQGMAGNEFYRDIDAATTNKLSDLCQEAGATLFMGLFSVFSVLLSRYSNETDIVIGTPIANRQEAQVSDIIGFFINTLVLRCDLSDNPDFYTLLGQSRKMLLDAYAHQQVSFELIVEKLNPARSLSHSPLFQVMLVLQNAESGTLELPGLTLSSVERSHEMAVKYDITLTVNQDENGLSLNWEYRTDLFAAATIERMATHFNDLLDGLIAQPQQPVLKASLLKQSEQQKLLERRVDSQSLHGQGLCIQMLFEHFAASTPDAVAVKFDGQQLSYQQVNEKANQLAHYLKTERHVKPDTLVGLCVERSFSMVTAILAILKAGGAYVPIDPDYPRARLAFVIEDANLDTVITHSYWCEKTGIAAPRALCVDDDQIRQAIARKPNDNINPSTIQLSSHNLAYVIYTSGSTGKPKGVMIEHRSLINYLYALTPHCEGIAGSYVNTNICFDGTATSYWLPFAFGGYVQLACTSNADALSELLRVAADCRGSKLFKITPAHLDILADCVPDKNSNHLFFVGGEMFTTDKYDKLPEGLKTSRFYNHYGPSEATVGCATFAVTAGKELTGHSIPLGKPLDNVRLYVLGQYDELLPIGVIGELHISGEGLSRGYLRRAELTAEQFVDNPYNQDNDARYRRLYKTGDLVRLLATGDIEFIGRKDDQVKIRGFRIELGEIHSRLSAHPAVASSLVLLHQVKDQDKSIVAYVVAKDDSPVDNIAQFKGQLRTHLQQVLPDYMVPAAFVLLEQWPLTTNAKIDRRALPAPVFSDIQSEYVAPETTTERTLAEVWGKLLKLEPDNLSATANFFELGGHSLLSVRLMAEIRNQLSREVPIKAIFEAPDIRALAAYIDSSSHIPTRPPIVRVARDRDSYPTSFAQQRLWFIDRMDGASAQYNMPTAISVSGEFHVDAARQAIERIIWRHESLRTVFSEGEEGPVQRICDSFDFSLEVCDLTQLDGEQQTQRSLALIIEDAASTFDLDCDLMVRTSFVRLSHRDGKAQGILLFNMHHIASDGWSKGVLTEEFVKQYQAVIENKPDPLPPLAVQYVDFAHWQRQWLDKGVLEAQLAFWLKQLEDIPAVHNLPLDFPRPIDKASDGDTVSIQLGAKIAAKLQAVAKNFQLTPFMLLHGALSLVLSRHSNSHDIVVGTPVANRMQLELEPLIGFFVNTLVLRLDTRFDTLRQYFSHVREVNLDAQAHQDIPFEQLVEHCKVARSTAHSPLFQVLLMMNTNEQSELNIPGVEFGMVEGLGVVAKYDLDITVQMDDDGIFMGWVYDTTLFTRSHVETLCQHFACLLSAIAENPSARLLDLPMLSVTELDILTNRYNDTAREFQTTRLLHEMFEHQVERVPDNIAIAFEDRQTGLRQLSYQELNQQANQLARLLRKLEVGSDTAVGICVDRGIDMMVGVLAILKAGGAYVPLDPGFPSDRLEYMISDSGQKLLLCQANVSDRLQLPDGVSALHIDSASFNAQLQDLPDTNLSPLNEQNASNLAYVIYTSGSTGKPKGVMIEHSTITNFINAMQQRLGGAMCQQTRWLAVTTISFDIAGLELFGPLSQGGQVVIASVQDTADPTRLAELLKQHDITTMQATPATWQLLAHNQWQGKTDLVALCGGEALPINLARYLQSCCVQVWNCYGPTECTVWSLLKALDADSLSSGKVTIGGGLDNYRHYVLDSEQRIVPFGVEGELYIGGMGLARGYHNQEQLTDQCFIDHPLGKLEPTGCGRLYRTGDLVRSLPGGDFEFICRIDEQVKVRGFRIELGEIENALAACPEVEQAIVLAQGSGLDDKSLVAYVQPGRTILQRSDEASDNDRVDEWKGIWDKAYSKQKQSPELAQDKSSDTDISGWGCSYRGGLIPQVEMEQWQDLTVEGIIELAPKNILEIGIGTGMLLYRYAPHCQSVCGIDLSPQVIDQVSNEVARRGWQHVSLMQGSALDLAVFGERRFDLIVLNSVAQYFPSGLYFIRVFEQMMQYLCDGGKIFLGDLRNLDLLDAFSASVATYRAASDIPQEKLRQAAALAARNEGELLFSPSYFESLMQQYSVISQVDIVAKKGVYTNEMMRYRYDVFVHKSGPSAGTVKYWHGWQNREHLNQLFARHNGEHFGVHGFTNRRIVRDIAVMNLLNSKGAVDVSRLKNDISLAPCDDLHQLRLLSAEAGFDLKPTWSQAKPDHLDLIFVAKDADHAVPQVSSFKPYSQSFLINAPHLKSIARYLIPRLKAVLEGRLPRYMLPDAYSLLEQFPLTNNGKIDRAALATVTGLIKPEHYVAPQTPIEHTLVALWAGLFMLEEKDIGSNANFFELGGHSLLSVRLVTQIRQHLGVEVSIRTIFDAPDIRSLALVIEAGGSALEQPPIVAVDREAIQLPASYAQQRLWLLDKIDGGSVHYNINVALKLTGELNQDAVEQAFNAIVARHESLRTCFAEDSSGQPVQVLLAAEQFCMTQVDLSELEPQHQAHQVNEQVAANAAQVFDLSQDMMIKVQLIKCSKAHHVLVATIHHIASDGWSMGVLMTEFSALYIAFCDNQPNPLPPLAIQYGDYAFWQRNWLKGEVLTRQVNYWTDQLTGIPEVHNLPLDKPRPAVQGFNGNAHYCQLAKTALDPLITLCKVHEATLFMGLHAAFSVLLSRYSGETDIVIGSPVANREQPEVAPLIGFFMNNLVLRSDLSGEPTFVEVLLRSKEMLLDAYAHQQVPFEQVVEALQPQRSLSYSPLFQIMMSLQDNRQSTERASSPGLTYEPLVTPESVAKYDLTLNLAEEESGLSLAWIYNTDLFEGKSIQHMATQFNSLIERLMAAPLQKVSRIPVVDETFLQRFERWNQTARSFDSQTTIVELIEAQALKTPEATALVCGQRSLSYAQLNQQANQLACYLVEKKQLKPQTLVGVCLERSIESVVALIAILKAGGGCVPMDPEYPVARLTYMMKDANLATVLTQSRLAEYCAIDPDKAVCIDAEQLLTLTERYSPLNTEYAVSPEHLAYVIYTSGSTGQPKGVMIEHQQLTNLLLGMSDVPGFTEQDKLLAVTSFSFDIHMVEVFLPLIHGGSTVLAKNDETKSPQSLAALIERHQISVMQGTPSTWKMMVKDGWQSEQKIKIFCAGEALPPSLKDALLANGRAELWNLYGPTETCVYSAGSQMRLDSDVVVGSLIANTQLYVLDKYLMHSPIGGVGELYISGAGLSRGYLNQAKQTRENFIANPYHDGTGSKGSERLYKTGDSVRRLFDGSIQIIGRVDNQIKLRGFRIELSEIEHQLMKLSFEPEKIEDTVVVVNQTLASEDLLVAYIVSTAADKLNVQDNQALRDQCINALRQGLGQQLPVHMIPAHFVFLSQFPLTPNGKVDRKALPDPARQLVTQNYVAPSTETEKTLCLIWQDVLALNKVGVKDNFFAINGNSLSMVQVVSQAKNAGLKIGVNLAWQYQTISELAIAIDNKEKNEREQNQEEKGLLPTLAVEPGANCHVSVVRFEGNFNESYLRTAVNKFLSNAEVNYKLALEDGRRLFVSSRLSRKQKNAAWQLVNDPQISIEQFIETQSKQLVESILSFDTALVGLAYLNTPQKQVCVVAVLDTLIDEPRWQQMVDELAFQLKRTPVDLNHV